MRRQLEQPWRGTVCGRGLLAGIRGRPTATRRRPRMASGVGSLQHPYHITHTYCSLARAPHTHPLVFVTAVSHMRAGPVVRATSWSSKLSTQRSHRHRFCIAIARPHPPRTHAPRPHTQTGPPVSATRPSLVLFSRALCARMCAIAIALAQQHPPSSPPAALPSLPPSSWLTTSSSPAFTSVRWSDSSTQAAASSIP